MRILLLAAMVALAAACGSAERPAATTPQPPPPTPTPAIARAQEYRIGEEATTPKGNTMTVVSVDRDFRPYPPRPDRGYLAAEVTGCNRPDLPTPVAMKPIAFELQMDDGTRVGALLVGGKEPALTGSPSVAGECVRGWVSFEFPAGARPRYIAYYTEDWNWRPAVLKWRLE